MDARQFGGNKGNDLLEYLKGLEPRNLEEMTACAGDDVLEAMNSFIQRLLGEHPPLLTTAADECRF